MQAPTLVLAPRRAHAGDAVAPLRKLLQQVGEEVETMSQAARRERGCLPGGRAALSHGARLAGVAHRMGLCQLWEELARRTTAPDERQAMLIAALKQRRCVHRRLRVREELAKGNRSRWRFHRFSYTMDRTIPPRRPNASRRHDGWSASWTVSCCWP